LSFEPLCLKLINPYLAMLFDFSVKRRRDPFPTPLLFLFSLLVLQQGLETSERPVGRRRLLLTVCRRLGIPFLIQIPGVLIVMTIETQQFPIAAVGGIIIVVVILVMDRELTKSLACKFAPASRTDPRENLERSLPIHLLPTLSVAPSLGNDLIQPVGICSRLFR
jgi:hypothetical protein